ncbi:histone deacetylase, partial [Thermodesulfobacteriota bacterium]
MKRTGIVADPIFLEHVAPRYHPETERRLEAIYGRIEASGLGEKLSRIPLRRADGDEIALVHERAHIERVESLSGADVHLDADTYMSARSPEVARYAAGGAIDLVKGILAGDLDNGFALVRPPGHHAEADRGMGFCVYNNIAIAAMAAVEVHGLERVMIMDWDLHHGNGTQHSFYDDDRVLYASTHQYPFYPGTGGVQEVGRRRGEGYTVN